jgi:hypothetical protein
VEDLPRIDRVGSELVRRRLHLRQRRRMEGGAEAVAGGARELRTEQILGSGLGFGDFHTA